MFCQGTDLGGLTIGVLRNAFDGSSAQAPIVASFETALKVWDYAGANVVDNASEPRSLRSNIHSAQDLIVFMKTFP